MAINDIVQTIAEARVDARSLSEFVFKPAGFKVARRLAPTVDTLQFYIDRFDAYVTTVPNIVNDAINNTAVEGGVLADTFVTVTANGTGSVARTQRDKNNDIPSIKDFANVDDAQAAAISQGIKVFIPTGEHTYDLTNVDMTLFWGYGQLKDTATGAVYKPQNSDFVTPEMFGAVGDGITDDTKALQAAMSRGGTVKLISDKYAFKNISLYDLSGKSLKVFSDKKVELNQLAEAAVQSACLYIHAGFAPKLQTGIIYDTPSGSTGLNLSSTDSVGVGDIARVYSSRLQRGDNRINFNYISNFGQLFKIKSVNTDNGYIEFEDTAVYPYMSNSIIKIGNVVSYSPDFIKIDSSDLKAVDVEGQKVRITSGRGAGQEFYITRFFEDEQKIDIRGDFANLDNQHRQVLSTPLDSTSVYEIYETTTVQVYTPIRNLEFSGDIQFNEHPDADKSIRSCGITIKGVDNLNLRGISTKGWGYYGIQIDDYYNAQLKNTKHREHNFQLAGYGVQFKTGYRALVDGCYTSKCRSAFDAVHMTTFLKRINNTIVGGGTSRQGNPMFPQGTEATYVRNFGLGVHGNVTKCEDYHNTIIDVYYALTVRTKHAIMKHNTIMGNCMEVVHIAGGNKSEIVDNTYYGGEYPVKYKPYAIFWYFHEAVLDSDCLIEGNRFDGVRDEWLAVTKSPSVAVRPYAANRTTLRCVDNVFKTTGNPKLGDTTNYSVKVNLDNNKFYVKDKLYTGNPYSKLMLLSSSHAVELNGSVFKKFESSELLELPLGNVGINCCYKAVIKNVNFDNVDSYTSFYGEYIIDSKNNNITTIAEIGELNVVLGEVVSGEKLNGVTLDASNSTTNHINISINNNVLNVFNSVFGHRFILIDIN